MSSRARCGGAAEVLEISRTTGAELAEVCSLDAVPGRGEPRRAVRFDLVPFVHGGQSAMDLARRNTRLVSGSGQDAHTSGRPRSPGRRSISARFAIGPVSSYSLRYVYAPVRYIYHVRHAPPRGLAPGVVATGLRVHTRAIEGFQAVCAHPGFFVGV